jgi:predicted HAD superfamily Cof-like phosphohydrolase
MTLTQQPEPPEQLDMFASEGRVVDPDAPITDEYPITANERPDFQNYRLRGNLELANLISKQLFPQLPQVSRNQYSAQIRFVLDDHLTRMANDIISFHHKFGLVYDGPPRILPDDLRKFRVKFMQEELDEYNKADCSSIEVDGEFIELTPQEQREAELDALVDLVYVALGTAYLQGFNFAEAWRRVHTANMAKVRAERPEDSKRGSGFDVIKPEGWTAPNHSDLT